jgi:hypothetical protein
MSSHVQLSFRNVTQDSLQGTMPFGSVNIRVILDDAGKVLHGCYVTMTTTCCRVEILAGYVAAAAAVVVVAVLVVVARMDPRTALIVRNH